MSGGSSQPATTQQTSKVELPAWVNEASQSNYQFAKDVAGRPLQQYEGDRVAAPSAMTTQGYDAIKSGIGAENPTYQSAEDIYKRTSGPLDISSYLSPYTNEVEQRAIGNANTALDQRLAQQRSDAQKASVFGGSRMGVQQGVTTAEGVKGIGDLSAGIRQAGFDTASRNALADRSGMQNSAAGLLSTAAGRGAQRGTDIASLLGAGQQEQGSRQNVINAAMGKFDEARNYPVEQLNLLLASL